MTEDQRPEREDQRGTDKTLSFTLGTGTLNTVAQILAAIVKIGVLPCIAAYLIYMGAKTLPDQSRDMAVIKVELSQLADLQRQSNVYHEHIAQAIERQCVVVAAANKEDVRKCYPQP